MKLTSPAFTHEGVIPSLFTCDGENINPELHMSDVPEAAMSLVLLMDDPDVPAAIRPEQMWDHWVMFNIPTTTTIIEQGSNPAGTAGANTRGDLAYGGPCPPTEHQPTTHRYFFKLYALDCMLDLPEGASKAEVEAAMKGHVLEETVLLGCYDRTSA